MKKSKKRGITIIAMIIILMFSIVGCGAEYDNSKGTASENIGDSAVESGDILGENVSSELMDTGIKEDGQVVSTNRKIIEKVYIYAQTKDFDSLLDKVESEMNKIGGYIENSSISGNDYEYNQNRHAELIIRVPAKNSGEFTKFVSENSTVTRKEVSTEDVTLSYVDMESRVKALETEKATLERLMAEAVNMADVISIQERLTEVIYEIESYESQLRTYDNLIEFTTITVNISEVERVTIVEEQTVFQEIGTNLKRNFESVGHGLERIFVFGVSSIPYLLVIAAYVAVIITIIIICKKRRKKKQLKKES